MRREQPMSTTSGEEPLATDPEVFAAIFQQNWENVRHIKSERMWFLNTHAITSAGTLSLLQTIHGEFVLQLSLLLCMCVLSAIGVLISLRLKAELEECLQKNRRGRCCVSEALEGPGPTERQLQRRHVAITRGTERPAYGTDDTVIGSSPSCASGTKENPRGRCEYRRCRQARA